MKLLRWLQHLRFLFETGFSVLNLDFSPIRGPEGNIEYLVFLSKSSNKELNVNVEDINNVVNKSHSELSGE